MFGGAGLEETDPLQVPSTPLAALVKRSLAVVKADIEFQLIYYWRCISGVGATLLLHQANGLSHRP